MRRLNIQNYIKDVTQALPAEERESRQRTLRRELSLLTDAYLERGKSPAEAEQAVIAHYDPTYASLTRTRIRQEVVLLFVIAALILLGTVLPPIRILNQPQAVPGVSSGAPKPVDMTRNAALAELGTFRSIEITPPVEASSYTLFLMRGDELVSALPGNTYLSEPSDGVHVTFGPTLFTHHRCEPTRSFYIATSYGSAELSEFFVCYENADGRSGAPQDFAPYVATLETALENQPLPLIARHARDKAKLATWTPLLAHYERRYGWRDETLESLYLESVSAEEWYVLYIIFHANDSVDLMKLEPPSFEAALAAEDNLLSLWNDVEQNLENTPRP